METPAASQLNACLQRCLPTTIDAVSNRTDRNRAGSRIRVALGHVERAWESSRGSEDVFRRTLTPRTIHLDVVAGTGGNILDLQRGHDRTTELATGMATGLNTRLVVTGDERRSIDRVCSSTIAGRDVMDCARDLEQSPSLIDPDVSDKVRNIVTRIGSAYDRDQRTRC